jgi:hypothetical protein
MSRKYPSLQPDYRDRPLRAGRLNKLALDEVGERNGRDVAYVLLFKFQELGKHRNRRFWVSDHRLTFVLELLDLLFTMGMSSLDPLLQPTNTLLQIASDVAHAPPRVVADAEWQSGLGRLPLRSRLLAKAFEFFLRRGQF